ncbi:LCP family protein [Paenibacillus tarimensis]|uniref:LCP family protein n=1 Tax=Paenibacillus tarimensis TaxID=416012 RepID=UPI001F40AFF2|nr:LCP family protein [Paenibacillus tarimensis]MCF2944518.1 LCP family protein [Paenibacillus tarimensis]
MLHRRWQKWTAGILAAVLVLGIIGYFNRTALALWGFDTFLSGSVKKKLEKSYQPLEGRPETEPVSYKEMKPFSLLLLGVDQRKNERGRSDTMIVTVVRPEDGAVLMISIPRDSYVEIPGRSRPDKITHAYAYGEAGLAVQTVEEMFDMHVDHYATINFEGFRNVIDAMGGIKLPIKKDIVNNDAMHEKFIVKGGQQIYNGTDALNFVRYREDAGGDISRTQRHQIFLNAILNKAAEMNQWAQIPELIDIMGDNFTMDIVPDEMVELGKALLASNSRTIYSHTLKGEGRLLHSNGGGWYFFVEEEDLDKAKGWVDAWLNDSTPLSSLPLPDQYQAKKPVEALSAAQANGH